MKLILYKRDSCPCCQKVLGYLHARSRTDVELRDIAEDESSRQTLLRVGGKVQVPCLFVDGRPLYESDDIILWLGEHPRA